ncbi:hypothetical protein ACNKHU_13435 [Shigella flexneri]
MVDTAPVLKESSVLSLDIDQIALHQLIKRDQQNLELVLRDTLLEPTEPVVEMVADCIGSIAPKIKLRLV